MSEVASGVQLFIRKRLPVMSPWAWMALTSARGEPRSLALIRVDSTVRAYHHAPTDGALTALDAALETWMRCDPDWRGGARSLYAAPATLRAQINQAKSPSPAPFLPPDERQDAHALAQLQPRQSGRCRALFTGAEIALAPAEYRASAQAMAQNLHRLKDATRDRPAPTERRLQASRAIVDEFLRDLLGNEGADLVDLLHVVRPELAGAFLAEFAQGAVLLASEFAPIGRVLTDWSQLARSAYRAGVFSTEEQPIRTGDPMAALRTMKTLMQQEADAPSAPSAPRQPSFSMSDLTGPLWGQTVSGAASAACHAIATLTQHTFRFIRDIKWLRAANSILASGHVSFALFEISPALGAYFFDTRFTSDSDIVAVLGAELGTVGWMDRVSFDRRRHLAPLQAEARRLLGRARLQVVNLAEADFVDADQTTAAYQILQLAPRATNGNEPVDGPEPLAGTPSPFDADSVRDAVARFEDSEQALRECHRLLRGIDNMPLIRTALSAPGLRSGGRSRDSWSRHPLRRDDWLRASAVLLVGRDSETKRVDQAVADYCAVVGSHLRHGEHLGPPETLDELRARVRDVEARVAAIENVVVAIDRWLARKMDRNQRRRQPHIERLAACVTQETDALRGLLQTYATLNDILSES